MSRVEREMHFAAARPQFRTIDGLSIRFVVALDLEPYRQIGGRQTVDRVIETLERYRLTAAAREDVV